MRDAPHREINLPFRHLKSLSRKPTNMLSICYYSSAISLPGNQSTTRKFTVVDHAVDCFVDAIDRHLGYSPLLNRDYQSFFKVRSTQGKVL